MRYDDIDDYYGQSEEPVRCPNARACAEPDCPHRKPHDANRECRDLAPAEGYPCSPCRRLDDIPEERIAQLIKWGNRKAKLARHYAEESGRQLAEIRRLRLELDDLRATLGTGKAVVIANWPEDDDEVEVRLLTGTPLFRTTRVADYTLVEQGQQVKA